MLFCVYGTCSYAPANCLVTRVNRAGMWDHSSNMHTQLSSRDRSLDLGRAFINVTSLCMRAVNALARLRGGAGSCEPLLVAKALNTNLS